MANELDFDPLLGVGNEKEIFELSHAKCAEELKFLEIIKESMIASEKELGNAVCEAIETPECPVCNRLSCTECTIPHQGSVILIPEPRVINPSERAKQRPRQRFSCIEQQKIKWDNEGKGGFQGRKPTKVFRVRGMGDVPQTSSRNKFHIKTSSWSESDQIVGTGGNTEDPKGKGRAIDDGLLLVSKWKSDSGGGNISDKQWVDVENPNPLKGSKDNKTNAVEEDDYESLDDEYDFDSNDSKKSHESRKKSKWFKEFFERMDALNIEEIDETLWHCPACQGGPGAIKWYRSISNLIAHSNKIGSRRVKLHRELAELLEGELCIKGTSIPPADPIYGTWKGLTDDAIDHQIVWPPMVVIMNTMTSNIKDEKFVGMGNQELLEHFNSYPALKAQHSYSPQGHHGLSVLIFEESAVGYLEAERLHKNFLKQRLGRSAWNSCTNEVLPCGERQLYGFMAVKEDMDVFNQHFQGNSKIKHQLKSYQEAVLNEIKKMRKDGKQIIWFKDMLEEERKRVEAFEISINNLSRNLQQKMEDIHILKNRVKSLHEDNKEELESQESFYKDQIKILEARVTELDDKLKELGANTLHTGEPALAIAELRGESDLIVGTGGNTEVPKGRGRAIDGGLLLVSKWKSDSGGGNRSEKQWVDVENPNPLKGSEDNKTNDVEEDDYDSLDDKDDFDSDDSQKNHESRKKSKWFKEFFERMDALNIEEIDETLWHCPACQGGPGAIKWYRSISDLIAHSNKIGSRRVKLHRELAELLEGELCIKGTSILLDYKLVLDQ